MSKDCHIRTARASDYDILGELIFDAVHNGPTKYTTAQSKAWAPEPKRGPVWGARLDKQHVILAEREGEILGFMSIDAAGYVDFAYIRPGAQGSGLFRTLYAEVETWARARNIPELSTHASLMAQPAFTAMGFIVDFQETVEANGQQLPRARMSKPL